MSNAIVQKKEKKKLKYKYNTIQKQKQKQKIKYKCVEKQRKKSDFSKIEKNTFTLRHYHLKLVFSGSVNFGILFLGFFLLQIF